MLYLHFIVLLKCQLTTTKSMMSLGRDILLAAASAGVVVFLYNHSRSALGFILRYFPIPDGCLVHCTCAQNENISCQKHDLKLLTELSKRIAGYDTMILLGVELGVNRSVILSCKETNATVFSSTFEMLSQWYNAQDGLGLHSEGLRRLKEALEKINLPLYNRDIIDRHFEEQ